MMKRYMHQKLHLEDTVHQLRGIHYLTTSQLLLRRWICIAERNTVKQGLVTLGIHIPIVSEEEFLQRMPEHELWIIMGIIWTVF